MAYYLAREGVAFGPYSEFQLRESLRLEIFREDDLALAGDAKEWVEAARILPKKDVSRLEPQPLVMPQLPATPTKPSRWLEVSEPPRSPALPGARPDGRAARPLPEHLLRQHETLFVDRPSASFVTEALRGKLAVAAVPVVTVLAALLTMAAMIKHHEPARRSAPGAAARMANATQSTLTAPPRQAVSLPPDASSLANAPWRHLGAESLAALPAPGDGPGR